MTSLEVARRHRLSVVPQPDPPRLSAFLLVPIHEPILGRLLVLVLLVPRETFAEIARAGNFDARISSGVAIKQLISLDA